MPWSANWTDITSSSASLWGHSTICNHQTNKPRSVEFVCDEVAAADSADKSRMARSSGKVVMSEKDASKFFRGGRFNRRESQQRDDDDAGTVEEKKE
eukprot:scaffold2734_cov76-Skeletonema_menzelii.AAC.4